MKKKTKKQGSVIKPKHDELFRNLMSYKEAQKEFFEEHLDEEVKILVDLDTIKMEKSDFLSESLDKTICDLLFSVKYKDTDETGYLNLLLEAQSTPHPNMAFRIMQYNMEIWSRHIKANNSDMKKKIADGSLPLIVSMIFTHANNIDDMQDDFFSLFQERKELAKKLFCGPYRIIHVNNMPDEELLHSGTYSGAMKYIFKYSRSINCLEKMIDLKDNFTKIIYDKQDSFIRAMVSYLVTNRYTNANEKNFKEILCEILPKNMGEDTMGSLAEKWYHDGEIKGILKGKLETAKKMLQDAMPHNIISKYTRLELHEIERLAKELKAISNDN